MRGWRKLLVPVVLVGMGGCATGKGTGSTVSPEFDETLFSSDLPLVCRLEAVATSPPGQQLIRFKLINRSGQTLHISGAETPLLELTGDHFLVMRDGVQVEYQGILVASLPPEEEEDWITIEAGKMIVTEFDLAEFYDLGQPGIYTIQYLANLANLVKGEEIDLLTQGQDILGIGSNALVLDKGATATTSAPPAAGEACQDDWDCYPDRICTQGKCQTGCTSDDHCQAGTTCQSGKCAPGCNAVRGCPVGKTCKQGKCQDGCTKDSECGKGKTCSAGKCSTACRTDTDCRLGQSCIGGQCGKPSGCDATHTKTLKTQQQGAASMAGDAQKTLKGVPQASRKDLACYKTWFGKYAQDRYNYVETSFGQTSDRLQGTFTYYCKTCQKNVIAFVYPNKKDEINICQLYWARSDSNQKKTLLHEVTHFVIQNDPPESYGVAAVQRLAKTNPTRAIHNAENYSLFDYGSCKTGAADCSAETTGTSGCDALFKSSCLKDLTPADCSMQKACGECTSQVNGSNIEINWKSGFSEKITCAYQTAASCDIVLADQGRECARIAIKSDGATVEFKVERKAESTIESKTYSFREVDASTLEVTCPDGKKEQYKRADLDRCKITTIGKPPSCTPS